MAAGVANHVWGAEEMIRLLEAVEPNQRGQQFPPLLKLVATRSQFAYNPDWRIVEEFKAGAAKNDPAV